MKMGTAKQKVKTPRDSDHLVFIRNESCCICDKAAPSEAAHVRLGGQGGIALKPSDYRTVPLCHSCHAKQHQQGEQTFWAHTIWNRPEVAITSMLIRRLGFDITIAALSAVLDNAE